MILFERFGLISCPQRLDEIWTLRLAQSSYILSSVRVCHYELQSVCNPFNASNILVTAVLTELVLGKADSNKMASATLHAE